MTVQEATRQNWSELVLTNEHVAVDFWAEWCGFCKQLAPVYEEVSNETPEIKFVKVNVQEELDLAQEYGVQGIPVIKFFCKGREVGSVVGYRSKVQLKQDIAKVLSEDIDCVSTSSVIS